MAEVFVMMGAYQDQAFNADTTGFILSVVSSLKERANRRIRESSGTAPGSKARECRS